MAFEVFGAGAVQTAYVSYLALDISEHSITLLWPTSYVNAPYTDPVSGIFYNILAASMDVVVASPNDYSITLPDARQSGVGQNFIIRNIGAASFDLKNSIGVVIQDVVVNISYWVQLIDNSTREGVWTVITFGAGTSQASAIALAGLGLTALGGPKLNTDIPVQTISADPGIDATSRAKIYIWQGGTETILLPTPVSVDDGFYLSFNNQGDGTLTIDPGVDITIDNQPDVKISRGQSLTIIKNANKWWSLGLGQNQFAVVTENFISVTDSGNITLTDLQASNILQRYGGTVTGNITIFFPATQNYWYINNETSGGGLSVQLAGGLGAAYVISQGTKQIFYSDGLTISPLPTAVQLADGTKERPSISFLGAENTGIYRDPDLDQIGFSVNSRTVSEIFSIGDLGSETGIISAISGDETELQISSYNISGRINYNEVDAILIDLDGAVSLHSPLPISSGGTGATTKEAAAIAILPAAVPGNMLYFTDTDWVVVVVPADSEGFILKLVGGVPTWVAP